MNKLLLTFAVASAVAILSLSGCSSDSGSPAPPPDPLAVYKSQVVNWQTCDPGILGVSIQADGTDYNRQEMLKAQADLGERLKCAMITVPLDHDNPTKGDLKIAVMRTAAGRPALRRGAIFFNPGGPGGDGLWFAAQYALKWNNLNPPDAIATELKKMSDQYDLIGFSPRGVGASTQLIVATNEQTRLMSHYDRSNQNIQNMLYNARLTAETSLKNPLTPYINTEQTVRDMDLIRHLLGDEKLNYIGYSYGTWLGAWYAGRFPERAGRMLLDSAMNFAGNRLMEFMEIRALGEQRVFDQVLVPYGARHNNLFALGTSPEEVRAAFYNLPMQLREQVYSLISINSNAHNNPNDSMRKLRAGQVLHGLQQAYPNASWEQMVALIHQTSFMPDPQNNQATRQHALALTEPYYRSYRPVNFSENAVNTVVKCNDSPDHTDEWYWINLGNQQAVTYPFYGGVITWNPCIYWNIARPVKPAMAAVNRASEGILILQSRYDALTPVEGALQAFNQLQNGSMIMVEREYKHGLFPYDTECVDLAVARYFNEGVLPERSTVCDGKTDIIPPTVVQAAKAAVSDPKSVDRRSTIYRDLAKDEEINRIIRSMIK